MSSCASNNTLDPSAVEKYNSMIEQLNSRTDFKTSSEYFDIDLEVGTIDDGYRFYITIDNPKAAMYNVQAVAIEGDVDYQDTMAANIGLFEDTTYCLIPNQTNVSKGFVKGINISGVSNNENPIIYVLVSWSNKDLSVTKREFFKLGVNNEG